MPSSHYITYAIASLVALIGFQLCAQQTSTSNCTVSGSTVNCTTNTTDYGAQRQRNYEQGQQAGAAVGALLGKSIALHSQHKALEKYCAVHPGEVWKARNGDGIVANSGICPTGESKASAAAYVFVSRHKSYIRKESNAQIMAEYIDNHKLDPREEKSFERAYKELTRGGQLELYAK